jgi:hypothetical protein
MNANDYASTELAVRKHIGVNRYLSWLGRLIDFRSWLITVVRRSLPLTSRASDITRNAERMTKIGKHRLAISA